MRAGLEEAILKRGDPPLRIHLIGVAGSGMSGLASLFMGLGHRVSGSDKVTTVETERMLRVGLNFSCPHTAEAVEGADFVVYSSAVKEGNVAFDAAKKLGIPLVRRAEALAAVLAAKRGIVVAGTHGKTTTSAMAAHVLRQAGLKSSHYVGAEIPVLGTNAHWEPGGELMVAEGDESDGTLVNFAPEFAVLLNVEAEHLDFYPNLEAIHEVFRRFLDQTTGTIFYCGNDPGAAALCENRKNAVSYGWNPEFDFAARGLAEKEDCTAFEVLRRGEVLGSVVLGIPGRHNVLNSLGVIALATELEVPLESIQMSLETFRGARRRFEIKYRSPSLTIVDDYGHHPTEIAATVKTARTLNPKRLVGLFQPHRYSRTQFLRREFGSAFHGVDHLFVTDVYPASEMPIPGINGGVIVEEVARAGGPQAESVPDVNRAHLEVGNFLRKGDMFLSLGAGNVHEAAARIAADMAVLDALREAMGEADAPARLYEPMRNHTTLRVGGPAQFWVEPGTFEGFARVVRLCRKSGIPLRVIGRGSNLLVQDGGIRGVVVHPAGGDFSEVRVERDRLIAGSGVRFKRLTSAAREAGLGGFEWMEGIPGSVGGGLRMNAGAMGWATFEQVESVTIVGADGVIREKPAKEFEVFYRNVPQLQENYVLSAVFRGTPAKPDEIDSKINLSIAKRKESQPVAASAGCIFKNPKECSAGMLVDQLGLKDSRVGNARVSEIHVNFIVNDGRASSAEVLSLIDHIVETARSERNIELETEVQIVGEKELFLSGEFRIESEGC